MPEACLTEAPAETPQPAPAPTLLVELESWPQAFFDNLRDTFFASDLPPLHISSAPAPFWHDVFVERGLPWRRFVESGGLHVVAIALLLGFGHFLDMQPQPAPRTTFDHTQVIYYSQAEYLPPLDTRPASAAQPRKADPAISRQPIISVPREADNRSQTIVTAPNVKLDHDVPLPNIVSWSDKPKLPIAPPPLVPASSITRLTPQMENSVVAPPPDAARASHRRDLPNLQTSVVAPPPDLHATSKSAYQPPPPSVIAPPPSIDSAARPIGDLNIGRSSVIAPAPQLSVGVQRAVRGAAASALAGVAPQVVPPPPSLSGSGSSSAGGRVIALNLHPAVGAPPNPPAGNRLGNFAATPDGHAGASGTPGSASGSNAGADGRGNGSSKESGSGSKRSGTSDLPAGLYVGNAASPANTAPVAGSPAKSSAPANTVNPRLLASLPPPRVSSTPTRALQAGNEASLSEAEREVFGPRKFYALTLNMPNLNSSGGSWVIRFAELKQDSGTGDLSAPAATHKVDPGYPLQIMRENVAGIVILYAVIHADGSVGNVRILRGVDDRLDRYASQALAQWQFHPATKNGAPVDVEATFQISFKPQRQNF